MFQTKLLYVLTDHRVLIGVLYIAVAFLLYSHFSGVKSLSKLTLLDIDRHGETISEKLLLKLRGSLSISQSNLGSNSINVAPHLQTYPELCKGHRVYGNDHHGGWVVCNDNIGNASSERCVVYSYGLGADWSFDKALEDAGCEIHGFDPSGKNWRDGMHGVDYSIIDYAKQYPSKNKHFHNWGLGAADVATYPAGTIPQEWPGLGDPQLSSTNSEAWDTKSFEKTFSDLGHTTSVISILKVDVEGAEWDAFAALFGSAPMEAKIRAGQIKQLLVEWHWDPESRARNSRHATLLARLEQLGFRPWFVNRHEGSDCCLDVSYIWKG